MAKQPEAKFKTKVQKVLKDAKRIEPNFVIAPNDAVTRGISDLLICWRGKFVALELKIDTPLSELQRIFLHEVRLGVGRAGVLRLMDDKQGLVHLSWMSRGGTLSSGNLIHLNQLPGELAEVTAPDYFGVANL